MGLGAIKDSVVRSLALRFLRGKVDGLRKAGSPMIRSLDGKKSVIVTVAFVGSGLVALISGNDVSQWLELVLRAIGWNDPTVIATAKETATQLVPLLFAAWAAASALRKWWKQHQAGAKVGELGSPVGVVKAALAAGAIVDARGVPMVDASLPRPVEPPVAAALKDVVVIEGGTK